MSDHLIAEANRHAMALPSTHPTHTEIAWYVREVVELRAEVERWQAEAAEMSAQRSHNANQAGRLRAEVERLKQQIKEDNRSYGCELRDPNGTIWEQAAKDHARAERAEGELANIANAQPHTWGDEADQFQAWAQNRARAAIDAAMKPKN